MSVVLLFPIFFMFDPMSELSMPAGGEDPLAPTGNFTPAPRPNSGGFGGPAGGARSYGEELHSVTIRARQRTFYVDLKQSGQGKFVKVSEKSRGGQKSTVIFDAEDLAKIIEALQEMQTKI